MRLRRGHDVLGKELRRRMASVEGKLASLRRDDGYEAAQEAEEQSGAGAADRDGKPPSKPSMRREYPDLATLEPAPDDEEIFGAAWPLIVEWRKLLDAHPERGEGVEWLTTQERVLEVELAPPRRSRDDPAAREAAAAGTSTGAVRSPGAGPPSPTRGEGGRGPEFMRRVYLRALAEVKGPQQCAGAPHGTI